MLQIQSDAGHYTAEPLYTPKTLQRNAAFQWDCSGSSAPFADTASIEPCSEYLEPVLRGGSAAEHLGSACAVSRHITACQYAFVQLQKHSLHRMVFKLHDTTTAAYQP